MRIASFLLLMLLYAAMYSFPALTPAMAKDFGTSRSALQGAFAGWSLAIAAFAPLVGRAVDRHGLRRTLMAGVVSLVGMLIGLGAAQSPWQIYAVLIGGGAPAYCFLQVATLVAAGRTGAGHRGNAIGFAGAGIGVGLTFLLPGTLWLSELLGWRTALLLLGGVSAVIGLPAVMTVARSRVAAPAGDADLSWGSLLRSRTFLLLFAGGIMVGLFDEALYQHLVPHLRAIGLSAALAGTILGCASLGYIAGQVIGGSLSDRWGRWIIGAVAALVASAGLVVFGFADPTRTGLFLTAFAAGLGLGATIAVRSAVLTDLFYGPSLGLVTGTYQWSYAIGAAIMSWAGSYVYERSGSYTSIFAGSAAAALLWMVSLRAALAIRARQQPSPSTARITGAAR
jgi:MFS transporter, OFA family, oxalate/formate antiporter